MNELIDVRTPLAVSKHTRVEVGSDGVLHVLAGPVTLHMERAICRELTTTLTHALQRLSAVERGQRGANLRLVAAEAEGD